MADFNFGFVCNAIEIAQSINTNIDMGPVSNGPLEFSNIDFSDFILNADRVFTVQGASSDFIWGQKWGNSKTRVG